MGNPAEETCCHPNIMSLCPSCRTCQLRNLQISANSWPRLPTTCVQVGCGEGHRTMPPKHNAVLAPARPFNVSPTGTGTRSGQLRQPMASAEHKPVWRERSATRGAPQVCG